MRFYGQISKLSSVFCLKSQGRFLNKTRCFCEAYTGLPVVSATENQKALNCVVLKYSIPVSEE